MKNSFLFFFIVMTFIMANVCGANLDFHSKFITPKYSSQIKITKMKIGKFSFPVEVTSVLGDGLDELSKMRHEVKVGFIEFSDFNYLKNYFNTRNLDYNSDRSYLLKDFLGAFIKMTEGKQFKSKDLRVKEIGIFMNSLDEAEYDTTNGGTISLSTNCWHTAFEFLRNNSKFLDLYYIPAAKMDIIFRDREYFREISLTELKYGDILYISTFNERAGVEESVHAAIYISDNYFYEKTGYGDNYIYRMVPFKTIEKSYPEGHFKFLTLNGKGNDLPSYNHFSIDYSNPSIAKKINNNFLTSEISMEEFFNGGITGYFFMGHDRIQY